MGKGRGVSPKGGFTLSDCDEVIATVDTGCEPSGWSGAASLAVMAAAPRVDPDEPEARWMPVSLDEVKAKFGADFVEERVDAMAERGHAAVERHRAIYGDTVDRR